MCRFCWKTPYFSNWQIYFRYNEFYFLIYGERPTTSDLFPQRYWWTNIPSALSSSECFGFLQNNSPPFFSSFSTVSAVTRPPTIIAEGPLPHLSDQIRFRSDWGEKWRARRESNPSLLFPKKKRDIQLSSCHNSATLIQWKWIPRVIIWVV